MNLTNIEMKLLCDYSNNYRRIWVQHTQISKKRSEYKVVITLFPRVGGYIMLFSGIINNINYEIISNIIGKNIKE